MPWQRGRQDHLGRLAGAGAQTTGAYSSVADEHGVESELHLESYTTFASVDLLADHMVASVLVGLSGTSQSSVSRRCVTATAERLTEFRSRPLGDRRWLIVFVDGFDFAGHALVGALGVTADGTKVPRGVIEGSTQKAMVVRGPITNSRDRGLDATDGISFVLDGPRCWPKRYDPSGGRHEFHGERAILRRTTTRRSRRTGTDQPVSSPRRHRH